MAVPPALSVGATWRGSPKLQRGGRRGLANERLVVPVAATVISTNGCDRLMIVDQRSTGHTEGHSACVPAILDSVRGQYLQGELSATAASTCLCQGPRLD